MTNRFLLAFSFVSVLMLIDAAVLASTNSLHKGTTIVVFEECDPINNPRSCPR